MSDNKASVSASNGVAGVGSQPTAKEAMFFFHILTNMTNKPEVDWESVAPLSGYNSANTAKTRFGQLKLKFASMNTSGGATVASPSTPRPRKVKMAPGAAVGSGTNLTPEKIRKLTPANKRNRGMKVIDEDIMIHEDETAEDLSLLPPPMFSYPGAPKKEDEESKSIA